MTRVAIILVDYNSHDHTEECLRSLEGANFADLAVDVIVVDNGSREPLQLPQQPTTYSLTLLRLEENTGFTGGNNAGIAHAQATTPPDYFLLLNNDTLVDSGFLKELVSFAQSEDRVGVVSPMIYFAPGCEYHADSYSTAERGNVIWFAGGSIDWKHMFAFHRGVDQVDRGQFDWPELSARRVQLQQAIKERPVDMPYISGKTMDFATGCCMLIPATVLDQVGVFDQDYFLYWEDVDLSHRIKQVGYSLYFCPTAKIWHKNAGSSGGAGSSLHQHYQQRNRLRFGLRYAPLATKIRLLKDTLTRRLRSLAQSTQRA